MKVPKWLQILLFSLFILGLPVATWLDMSEISNTLLQRQALSITKIITGIREYYSKSVVDTVLHNHKRTQVSSLAHMHAGSILIPSSFSIELGKIVSADQSNVHYAFLSDHPFKHRPRHDLDPFQKNAIITMRAHSLSTQNQPITTTSTNGFTAEVRIATPIIMQTSCVGCHNTNHDSTKHDWKVGDVRGIQEVDITEPLLTNFYDLRYLLLYLLFSAFLALMVILIQRRDSKEISEMNQELGATNGMLAAVATKVSRYLSPQVYESIFSGKTDCSISTKRKRLTIFFSDIKDFTSTTERLQPEALTTLLNDYFTEMSVIAIKHGGTIDKFIGDAILIFFGDPESRGAAADAQACLRMALEMQQRLYELNIRWSDQGLHQPLAIRIGINTGYCDVGNFGSKDRMDYTIIGGEANLAARLESSAAPNTIVVSYETYALIRTIAYGYERPPIHVKGIHDAVVSYVIEGLIVDERERPVFAHHSTGSNLYLDIEKIPPEEARNLRTLLSDAVDALDKKHSGDATEQS